MPFQSRAQKEYLRINEPEIYERWMREYDAESNQSFTPPAAAVAAAKKGLAQRKKWGRGGLSPAEAASQGIDSGVTRARKISSGKVSRHDVRRMSAFNRHRKNNNPSKKMPDGGPTAGTIAWNLWGGSAGVNWAKKKSAAMNAEEAIRQGFCPACGETDLMLQYYEDSGDFGCLECGHQWFEKTRMRAEMPALTGEDELKTYQVSVPVLHYYGIGPVEAYDEDEAADEVRNNWRSHWRHTIEDNGDWGGPLWRYSPLTSHEPEAYEIFASETFNALSPICKRCGLSEAGSHHLDPTGETGICILCTFNQKMGLNAESFGPVDEDGILAKALAQARAKSKEPRRPLKITKLPHQDQTSLKDFEAETKELPFSVSRKDIALVSFGAILGVVSGVIGEVLAEFWLDRYRRDPELVSSDDDENA